jgi:hypothetical protein
MFDRAIASVALRRRRPCHLVKFPLVVQPNIASSWCHLIPLIQPKKTALRGVGKAFAQTISLFRFLYIYGIPANSEVTRSASRLTTSAPWQASTRRSSL